MPNTTRMAQLNAQRLGIVASNLAIHIPREDQEEIETNMAEAEQLMQKLNHYLNSHFWRWQCPKCKEYPSLPFDEEHPHTCKTAEPNPATVPDVGPAPATTDGKRCQQADKVYYIDLSGLVQSLDVINGNLYSDGSIPERVYQPCGPLYRTLAEAYKAKDLTQ